jgi:hypothetical protein
MLDIGSDAIGVACSCNSFDCSTVFFVFCPPISRATVAVYILPVSQVHYLFTAPTIAEHMKELRDYLRTLSPKERNVSFDCEWVVSFGPEKPVCSPPR